MKHQLDATLFRFYFCRVTLLFAHPVIIQKHHLVKKLTSLY